MFKFCVDLTSIASNPSLQENILNDYELIKSFYLDNIEIISENLLHPSDNEEDKLSFKLNLRLEMEIDKNIREIIERLKFNGLILNIDSVGLPYWIKFDLHFDAKFLEVTFYVFWMRKKLNEFESFQENFINGQIEDIQDNMFFSICEDFKALIKQPEKNVLLNWLQEMKEEHVIKAGDFIPIDQIIFKKNHSDDIFEEEENNIIDNEGKENNTQKSLSLLQARTDKLILKGSSNIAKNKINGTCTTDKEIQANKEEEYIKFFHSGGIVGDIITDRGSIFQSHAIRINNINDVKKYLNYLKTNNKIFKATHNILSYRLIEKTDKTDKKTKDDLANVTEGFDEDGEDGAGIRLLGILQKMKVVNMMVVVSRWFGGINLGNDRFKHINDSAKNLIQTEKQKFDFQS